MADTGTERKDGAEEVAATDVRERLTELMQRAAIAGERFVFTVHGKDTAVLIGMRDYEALPRIRRRIVA